MEEKLEKLEKEVKSAERKKKLNDLLDLLMEKCKVKHTRKEELQHQLGLLLEAAPEASLLSVSPDSFSMIEGI